MLKLTGHVGITIFFLYKQKKKKEKGIAIFFLYKQKKKKKKKKKKNWWNSDVQNFYSEILDFRLFFAKYRNFQVRYNFMTS